MHRGNVDIRVGRSRDTFPSLNELTLCCLFLKHKATVHTPLKLVRH